MRCFAVNVTDKNTVYRACFLAQSPIVFNRFGFFCSKKTSPAGEPDPGMNLQEKILDSADRLLGGGCFGGRSCGRCLSSRLVFLRLLFFRGATDNNRAGKRAGKQELRHFSLLHD